MSFTGTFYAWWLWPYFAIGAVSFLPYVGWVARTTHPPKTIRGALTYRGYAWSTRRKWRRAVRDFVVWVAFWPVGFYEVAALTRRARARRG